MKKLIAITVVICMCLSLCACGINIGGMELGKLDIGGLIGGLFGGKEDDTLGVYTGTSVILMGETSPMSSVYPGTNTIELKEDGKGFFVLDGDGINFTYTLDGENLVIDIEGDESTGTLKDGVIKLDFMGMGFYMIFEKGGTVPSTTAPAATSGLQAGYYPLCGMKQEGQYIDKETINSIGLELDNYLVVNADGTAQIVMDGDIFNCTYTDTYFLDPDGVEINYAIVDGLVELYLDEMTFYYEKGDMSDKPTQFPADSAAVFPEHIVEDFYGDWHGWCVVTDGTGGYEDDIDDEFEILARYAFDEDGVCTPWMAIYADADSNFQDVVLTYDESDEFVYVSGKLFGMEILSTSRMYATFGSLCLTLNLRDESGDVDIVVCMRHPDAEWDKYDYPCMPDAAFEYYYGKSFEEIVKLFNLDPDDLPELS